MVVFIAKAILWLLLALTVIIGGAVIVTSFVKTGKEVKYDLQNSEVSEEQQKLLDMESRILELLRTNLYRIEIVDNESVNIDEDLLEELESIDPVIWKVIFDRHMGTNISGWYE